MSHTIGTRLIALRERSGLSLAELARLAGYKGASSIQKLFSPEYAPAKLDEKVASRLAGALVGKGDPAIEASEFAALTDNASTIEHLLADLKHYNYVASAYIGMHKTRRVGHVVKTEGGTDIPLFVREDMSGGLPVYPCPSYLRPRGVVGLYISVGNMWPRFEEGEPVFYEHQKPPARGDDVIVNIASDGYLDGAMIIGRLRLLHEEEVHLDVLTPSDRVIIPRSSVISVYRLIHTTDLLEPISYASAS